MMISTTGTTRIIALIDMDCFYVQVEERDDPSIKGKPAAVVQYKTFKGGGIIAVNYEARAKGISRQMRGDDAKQAYSDIILVRVPETRGKADLTKYRDAGREVIMVLSEFSDCVERASIDEAYIDLTEAVGKKLAEFTSEQDLFSSWEPKDVVNSLKMQHFENNFVLGYESTECWLEMIKSSEMAPMDDIKLALGAEIVGQMREAVFQKTGFRCSAGIGHNKVLAKLTCGINKPNKQTVLPHGSVPELWTSTKVKKVRNLGGKLGDYLVDKLKCEMMCDLIKFSEKELSSKIGSKSGSWIYQLARGYDDEPVNPRQLPKSIGCNKNFFGPEALTTKERVKFWIIQLSAEVVERIQRDYEMNNRRAKTMTLHVKFEEISSLSRSCGVHPQYNPERIASDAYAMMEKLYQTMGTLCVNMLGLVASKFEDEMDTSEYAKINTYFNKTCAERSTANSTITSAAEKDSASSTITSATVKDSASSNSMLINMDRPIASSSNCGSSSSITTINNNPQTHKLIPSEVTGSSSNTDVVMVNGTNHPTPTSNGTKTDETEKPVRKRLFVYSDTAPPKPVKKSPIKINFPAGVGIPDPVTGLLTSPMKLPVTQTCERCAKTVGIWDYVAHMDRHFAKDLSREINGQPPLGFDLRPEVLEKAEREKEAKEKEMLMKKGGGSKRPRGRGGGSTSGSKRGRSANTVSSSSSSTRSQPVRTIDSYFSKQS